MGKRHNIIRVEDCSTGVYRLVLSYGYNDECLQTLRCMSCLEDFNDLEAAEKHENNDRREFIPHE